MLCNEPRKSKGIGSISIVVYVNRNNSQIGMILMLKWQRVGEYGMQSGEYRVAKTFVDGCTLYQLFFGNELLKWCGDFDECREVAESHMENK